MDTSAMKYPFGRCAECGKEFNSELRNEYGIAYCPWCGNMILDYFNDAFPPPGSLVKPDMKRFIYCEDCGARIYELDGKGGNRIREEGGKQPGVCSGPCGRELCARCGDWDEEGECYKCQGNIIKENGGER